MKAKLQKVLTKVASIALVISLSLPAFGSVAEYALGAGSYSTLGTNKALGSPILNDNFSIDNWNKWEMIVWGIFLSNFTTPFIDNYNSAFNLDSVNGSKGSGAKALQFGSGRDVANTKVIQDLLNYAVNQQSAGASKQIMVSYNKVADGKITEKASFGNATPAPDEGLENGVVSEGDVAGADVAETQAIRQATVKDLIIAKGSGDGTTWVASTADNSIFSSETILATDNYVNMVGVKEANVPTFAIQTAKGSYETVFDYTDSYDLSIISATLSKGLTGDYKAEFKKLISSVFEKPEDYKLVLDCFGNICTPIEGTYRVIIPAAANKYLTMTPSINLANSLIFNASTATVGQDQIIMNAGQADGGIGGWFSGEYWQSGLTAFSNGASGIPAGSTMLFYDTDTIVYQDAAKSEDTAGNYVVNTGDLYKKLFNCDINSSTRGDYSFKIETANIYDMDYSDLGDDAANSIKHTLGISSQLVNMFNTNPNEDVLTELTTDVGKLSIFDQPVVVPVQLDAGMKVNGLTDWWAGLWGNEKKYNYLAIHRHFVNWAFQAYNSSIDTSMGRVDSSVVRDAFSKSNNPDELFKNLITQGDGGIVSTLFTSFIARRTDFYKVNDVKALQTLSYTGPGIDSTYIISNEGTMLENKNISNNKAFNLLDYMSSSAGGVDTEDAAWYGKSPFGRSAKVYTTSEVMRSIANILGVREGTDFSVYSMYIYLTYLDWYGITGSSLSSIADNKNTSKLNVNIFDGNSDVLKIDITAVVDAMTDAQKEASILDWTYLMLNPTAGREYRSQMIVSGVSDWIYDNYQKIVYGNASSYYDTGTGVTSRNSTGFLSVSPYAENFMTAWFVNNYAYFSAIMIGIFFILTILVGILRKRSASWFFVSIFVMVNMILILPATGDIVPLMSNNFVQDMFSDKMSYWAISESVTNATMEADYANGKGLPAGYMGKLSKEEQSQVINMVKNLNTLYLDRSINVKQDISKKVTQTSTSTFEDVQQLRSARWMLPMIMRQFTASDGSANYVYVPLGDLNDDLSNMYWYFKPLDVNFVKTVNAQQGAVNGGTIKEYELDSTSLDNINMRETVFQPYNSAIHNITEIEKGYKQKSYNLNLNNNVHTYSYMLDKKGLLSFGIPKYSDYKSYDDWAKAYANSVTNSLGSTAELETLLSVIERKAGEYSRFDRATIEPEYSYLWATENPLHYFYDGIKESLDHDGSLGDLVGELQGTYVVNEELGKEVRKTFMHAGETGNVRDILDLQEMFHNMIPYLYSMQLLAEGYDGEGGVFKDGDLLEIYKVYKDNNKSWMFRSNWVTKLMENRDYHKSSIIRLADGTKATVANMMLPSCYEEVGRPMIFSEAQMYAEGLSEVDLSLVELKCVKINKDASQKWTLMLNYASVGGMTKEVMVRQMALDSLIAFNLEFNPAGVLNGAYSMYPSGIDLRSISFDSIMKMLMLNVTHDTSYIYGDTMQTMVEDSDIFTAFLLLATAFVCAFIIPLARNLVMGLIFFLGLWAMLWSIFRSTKTKAKVSCGYVLSNFVFLIMTFIYYLSFKAIMAMTATDEVLSLSQIEVNTGNPVWCLIFVLLISVLYFAGICKMIQFCVKNYRDMGFEVYAGIAEMAAGGVAGKIESLAGKISGDNSSSSASGSRGTKKGEPIEVKATGGTGGSESGDKKAKEKKAEFDEYEQVSYTDGRYMDKAESPDKIDGEIHKGAKISKKATEKRK